MKTAGRRRFTEDRIAQHSDNLDFVDGDPPYEDFALMIIRHWDGIAAYCQPENKVALGFVEGLNNKIRVLQRRAYGLRDEEYMRLKILTCMLPEI